MHINDVAFSNSSMVAINVLPTTIDRSSLLTTVHRMSMMVYRTVQGVWWIVSHNNTVFSSYILFKL